MNIKRKRCLLVHLVGDFLGFGVVYFFYLFQSFIIRAKGHNTSCCRPTCEKLIITNHLTFMKVIIKFWCKVYLKKSLHEIDVSRVTGTCFLEDNILSYHLHTSVRYVKSNNVLKDWTHGYFQQHCCLYQIAYDIGWHEPSLCWSDSCRIISKMCGLRVFLVFTWMHALILLIRGVWIIPLLILIVSICATVLLCTHVNCLNCPILWSYVILSIHI